MDSESLVEFAKIALGRVARIATDLSKENRNSQWSRFGGALMFIEFPVDSPRRKGRILKLLRDVERMCGSSNNLEEAKTSLLQALVWAEEGSSIYRDAENRIRLGLRETTLMHGPALKAAIQHLKRFGQTAGANWQENDDADELLAATGTPTRYPKEIDAIVCNLLRTQMSCTCSKESEHALRAKHLTQLMLWPSLVQSTERGQVLLAMLFSSAPVHTESHLHRWQNVEMHFSWSERVRFSDHSPGAPPFQPSRRPVEVDTKQFCEMLGRYPDSRLRFVIQNGKFQESKPIKPVEPVVEHKPGISLAHILRTYSLTSRMRVALAYILAYSVWQYYDSDWVTSRWTSESVQFLKEFEESDAGTEGRLYAWKPYLFARFGDDEPRLPEYSTNSDTMHRYPRILALGILLVEIGIGKPVDPILRHSLIHDSDKAWLWALTYSQDREKWKRFDYPKYLRAVKSCLDPQNFFSATHRDGDTPCDMSDLTHRRGVLYQKVVAPLEDLLEKTGWMEELTRTGPVDTLVERRVDQTAARGNLNTLTTANQILCLPGAKISPTRCQIDAKRWLGRINALCRSLAPLQNSCTPIRIAILDTGCNIESTLFQLPQVASRLKEWRDFVSPAGEWKDCDGHGTYLTSLLMRIDPMAEIYVARIAESAQGLTQASKNIAQAILHATNTWKVDIISMSFGYAEDEPDIRTAIHEAMSSRNGSVLFFAAASNFGANQKELFPARHESVISIRATNCNGNFLDLNPPTSEHDGVVFGTLGLDVPSEPNNNGEVRYETGTSVATAIAAGIAGALIGFVAGESSRENFEQVKSKVRTRQGMQALFRSLAMPSQHKQYLYIAPWSLHEQSNSTRWSIIEGALAGC